MSMPSTSPCQTNCTRSWAGRSGARSRQVRSRTETLLYWLLDSGCSFLVSRFSLLVAGCWLLVAGCWWLVAGGWLLVVGCWLLAGSVSELTVGCGWVG